MLSDNRPLEAWRMLMGISQTARLTANQPAMRPGVPLTVVTGFLGSGKTTLVRNVLGRLSGSRIAVLINDFGSINIDAALVRNRTSATIELANGCVCCELSVGLANVLAEQLARSDPPDAFLLEASGIAEPLGILHVALSNPLLRAGGVVTVVDAELLQTQLADRQTRLAVEQQIVAADIVVLNKADLAGERGLETSRELVVRIAPNARVIEATFAEVPPEILLDTPLREPDGATRRPHELDRNGYSTWTFTTERMLDAKRVCRLAGELPSSILRAKGFLSLTQEPSTRHLLQVVGRRWSLTKEGAWHDDTRRSQIVFIGRSGADDFKALHAALQQCEVDHS